MECADDMSDESDSFQDAVPIPDHSLASSKFGVRGSAQKSPLLPSDAEQMLRVHKSVAHAGFRVCVSKLATQSLCEEASLIPQCVFDELSINYPDVQQLQRVLSQDWIRCWERWRSIQESLDKCSSKEMRQWTSQHVVIEITNLSLSQMVASFPSDVERCLQLTREGVVIWLHRCRLMQSAVCS